VVRGQGSWGSGGMLLCCARWRPARSACQAGAGTIQRSSFARAGLPSPARHNAPTRLLQDVFTASCCLALHRSHLQQLPLGNPGCPQDIYIARAEGELGLEEQLYGTLVNIYRLPSLMFELTKKDR
jgi:hypothetical protein